MGGIPAKSGTVYFPGTGRGKKMSFSVFFTGKWIFSNRANSGGMRKAIFQNPDHEEDETI